MTFSQDIKSLQKAGLPQAILRYGVAVGAVAIGLLCRLLLDESVGYGVPYMTFFPAVALTAWFGGLGPGILATLLSLITVFYVIFPPLYSLKVTNPANMASGALFVAVCGFIIVLNESLKRSQARSEEAYRQLKSTEEALRSSQAQLRAIYDGAYEYIALLDPAGKLLETNRASLEFAPMMRDEVIGRPFWETPWFASTPDAPESVKDAVTRAAQGEFVRFEANIFRPGSSEVSTFDISFYPVRNERGEIIFIVPEARDITHLKHAEEELKRSNGELTRANRELEEFAYVASHDLQEPLRMVNIYTQLILKGLRDQDTGLNQYAGFVREGVNRMEMLIRDLLEYSRAGYDAGASNDSASLKESLQEALTMLSSAIEMSGAEITAAALPTVRCETSQMTQVFQNLVSNSLKYSRKGVPPQIQIGAKPDGAQWIVSVTDNGIGFEPQYSERIFALFKRLHRQEYPGTGLGLAICQRIVERNGGHIWAEGRPGEGATFHFSLPRGDAKN